MNVLRLLEIDAQENGLLQLAVIIGGEGLHRQIKASKISRPGLPLSGFFEAFSDESIQVFGRGEQIYLERLEEKGITDSIDRLFSYPIPLCIFTEGGKPTMYFQQAAAKSGCAILGSPLRSSELSRRLYQVLDEQFAPTLVIHGVMTEVFGMGILITGESGVGKSETALELLERGHRLICDDAVKIRNIGGNVLMGTGVNPKLAHHMEIRGIGIVNVADMYGIGAIREKKMIQLLAHLEDWNPDKDYERIDPKLEEEILGIKVPKLIIPVKPGRNIPILIETAARNQRLKKLGYHASEQYDNGLKQYLESRMIDTENEL